MGYFDGLNLRLLEPEAPPPEKSGFLRRAVGDTAISAVKGAIGLPEMAVGLGNLVSGGRIGKAAEEAGFRAREAREYLDSLYSPEQQAANREVQQADGFIDTAAAAIRNPSTIAHAVVESAPSLLGAGGVARGLLAGAARMSPALAGRLAAAEAAPFVASQGAKTAAELTQLAAIGAGEGVVSAGATAEQIRQQTEDGYLTGEQSLLAAGSGALTGLIGGVAGKIANKLGIGDVQQMLAGVQKAGPQAQKALSRAMLEGFATEGILQELPQSAQEQIAQNVALGKPWDEGVGNAAAMGALAGGVMGGGVQAFSRRPQQPDPVDQALDTLATTKDVGQMIQAAETVAAAPLAPLSMSPDQEAPAVEPQQPARPDTPAPPPFLDRLWSVQQSLQDPELRARIEQGGGPEALQMLEQAAFNAGREGRPEVFTDEWRERQLSAAERVINAAARPAPEVRQPERRRSEPVIVQPEVKYTDPVLAYVDTKRTENTPAARMFVKEFEAGRITRRDVVRAMQTAPADPLTALKPAAPPVDPVQQRLERAAEQAPAPAPGLVVEPIMRARARTVEPSNGPGSSQPARSDRGGPVDPGAAGGATGVVPSQQQGSGGVAGEPVPAAVERPGAVQSGRGGDEALSEFVAVPTVFGRKVHVRRKDLDGESPLLRAFTSTGKPDGRIHRENLDQTGEKLARQAAEDAGNPAFDVITRKGGFAFSTQPAAERELKARGLGNTHEVVDAKLIDPKATGFAIRKKAAELPAREQAPASDEALSAQGPLRQKYDWIIANRPSSIAVGLAGESVPASFQQRQMAQKRLDEAPARLRGNYEVVGIGKGAGRRFFVVPKFEKWAPQNVAEGKTERAAPEAPATATPTDAAANQAATSPANDLPEPTQAQKEAGNYKVGRIKVAGLDISVENPAGSERSGVDPDGKAWRNTLAHHYGYIRRSEGADGDHVDVFVNPGTPEDYEGTVFVVDQADPKTGRFDEHKVMMGFPSAKAAQEAYQANYAKGWKGLRAVQPMSMEQFKAWVADPANTTKPAAKGGPAGKGEQSAKPDELVELRKRESVLKSLRECLG